jgi:hypothetical protein
MIKPNDFDNVQAYTGFTPLAPGGHLCKIMDVKEVTSQKGGRPMIVISIDTDKSDSQPNYFTDQFKNNTKIGKKWSNNAVARQLVFDADGNTNKGFKTFIEAVEKSNNGFKVVWGDGFVKCFVGKLVGGVFGREEYMNNDTGECKFATKFQSFRTIEDIKNGVEVPKDKLLNPGSKSSSNGPDLYEDITPVDDDCMPF